MHPVVQFEGLTPYKWSRFRWNSTSSLRKEACIVLAQTISPQLFFQLANLLAASVEAFAMTVS